MRKRRMRLPLTTPPAACTLPHAPRMRKRGMRMPLTRPPAAWAPDDTPLIRILRFRMPRIRPSYYDDTARRKHFRMPTYRIRRILGRCVCVCDITSPHAHLPHTSCPRSMRMRMRYNASACPHSPHTSCPRSMRNNASACPLTAYLIHRQTQNLGVVSRVASASASEEPPRLEP